MPTSLEQSLELVSLKGSPYSRRVKWALQVLNVDYSTTFYNSIFGEPSLRWRLKRWNPWDRVTVPVAFVKNDQNETTFQLENGLEIIEWAGSVSSLEDKNSGNEITTLIPPELRGEVVEFCSIADDLLEFERKAFLDAISEDPSLLRRFVGKAPPDSVLPAIALIASSFFKCKYGLTLQGTNCMTRKKLAELERTILAKKNNRSEDAPVYIVGNQLTLADIYLSVSICGGPVRESLSEFDKKYRQAIIKQSLDAENEFPVLFKWAKAICTNHVVDANKIF